MARGLKRRGSGQIFAIDPHVYGTEDELRENIVHFKLDRMIEPIVARSVETAEQWRIPLEIVFLDGDHLESAVEADIAAWMPHLQAGGVLVLHDSTELRRFSVPRLVADSIRASSSEFESSGTLGSIAWARRAGTTNVSTPRQYGKHVFDTLLSILPKRKDDEPLSI